MNWYRWKRRLLWPYIVVQRYRMRGKTDFIRSALELHYYRPAFYRFISATIENPDIMYDVPIRQGGVVLDVGAYIGDWCARIIELHQPRHLYLFEPEPGSVGRLQKRFADNDSVTLHAVGLGAADGSLAFVTRGMGSTFYDTGDTGDTNGGGEDVEYLPIRDVAAVLDELADKQIDLMKLNIEGGEYDVLERMLEKGQVARVHCFMIQFHEWLDGAHGRRNRIRQALRRTHREVWDYPFVWEQWVRKD